MSYELVEQWAAAVKATACRPSAMEAHAASFLSYIADPERNEFGPFLGRGPWIVDDDAPHRWAERRAYTELKTPDEYERLLGIAEGVTACVEVASNTRRTT